MEDSAAEEAWKSAVAADLVEPWTSFVDRREVCDFLRFAHTHEATRIQGNVVGLAPWITHLTRRGVAALHQDLQDPLIPIVERLGISTFERWMVRINKMMAHASEGAAPRSGVLHYFADDLALCALIEFEYVGRTADLKEILVIPEPTAYADPVRALKYARDDAQLDLIRRSLYSRHKVLIQRNTMLIIDREWDVFGPSIDTILLNDFLFTERYVPQRVAANDAHYAEFPTQSATDLSKETGTSFLEVGCGNGLLTATYARNEAKVRSFAALDMDARAIAATHENSYKQRLLKRGAIGDRGIFLVARYECDHVPKPFDLVVCNPPYVPLGPKVFPGSHPLSGATVGTRLLEQVIGDASTLLKPAGTLVIVASTLAEPEILASVPDGFEASRAVALDVPFRVESVLSSRDLEHSEWHDWLVQERGLRQLADELDVRYEHTVAVYVVRRKKDAAS